MKLKRQTRNIVILVILIIALITLATFLIFNFLGSEKCESEVIKKGMLGKKEIWKNIDRKYSNYEIMQYKHFGGGESSSKGEEVLLYCDEKFIHAYYVAPNLFNFQYKYTDSIEKVHEDSYIKEVFKTEKYIANTKK